MKPLVQIILAFSVVVLAWSIYPLILHNLNPNVTSNGFAEFGDSYGALNTLFSGLAFAGIIISLYIQSKDLKLNREDLKLTRDELELTRGEIRGQTEQLEAQANYMKLQNEQIVKQSFESTFFQMLNLHNEITRSMIIESFTGEDIVGRKAFKKFISMYYYKQEDSIRAAIKTGRDNSFEGFYSEFYEEHQDSLGHYFRNVYQILKLIDNSDIKDKKNYTNILRAQLSTYELAMLLLNCLSSYGKVAHKPFIEEYAFFEHLPKIFEIPIILYTDYDRKAYGKTNTAILNEFN